jgi:hypothetical protein
LCVPYCCPEIHSVAEVRVPGPSDDVDIFRVDGTEYFQGRGALYWGVPYLYESHELARLEPTDRKTLPSQWSVGIEHGWLSIGLENGCYVANKHTVAVRFYRIGFETINVGPGDVSKELDWKAVADLAGQEKAVDDLIAPNSRFWDEEPRHDRNHYRGLASGKISAAHREALLFCGQEYDRIASLVAPGEPSADGMRSRLEKKSNCLKELAVADAAGCQLNP